MLFQLGYAQDFSSQQIENIGRDFVVNISNNYRYDYRYYQIFPKFDSVNYLTIFGEDFKNTLNVKKISKFKNLKILELQGKFSNFPEPVFKLSEVQELILNKVTELDWNIFFVKCSKLPNLKSIKIYNCDLSEIPKSIELLINIEHLELNTLNIDYIPEVFSKLIKIKFLRITKTNISNIPSNFYSNELLYLDISNNSFNGLPFEIEYFPNLQFFRFIGNNYYSSNDTILCKLKKIKSINLSGCGLEKFPITLKCLLDINELILDDNMFDEIPDDITDFVNIKFISLDSFNDQKRISELRKKNPNCVIIARPHCKLNPVIEEFK